MHSGLKGLKLVRHIMRGEMYRDFTTKIATYAARCESMLHGVSNICYAIRASWKFRISINNNNENSSVVRLPDKD